MPQESTASQTIKFNTTTLDFLLNCDYIFFPSSLRIQATFPVEAIVCEKHIFAEPKKKKVERANQSRIHFAIPQCFRTIVLYRLRFTLKRQLKRG